MAIRHLPLNWLPSSSLSIHSPRQCIGRRSHLRSLRRSIVAVHEELRKDSKVENKGARASNQPAQVDQNVFAVNAGGLSGLAVAALVPVSVGVLAADRLEGKDAEDESQISKAGEEEEQGVEAFGRLAASVEQDLRHAASQVEDRANVTEDLAPKRKVQGRCLVVCIGMAVFVVGFGLGSRRAEVVARDAGDYDKQDSCAVEEERLEHGSLLRGLHACGIAQLVSLGVHWSSRRQHSSIEVVEMFAVS